MNKFRLLNNKKLKKIHWRDQQYSITFKHPHLLNYETQDFLDDVNNNISRKIIWERTEGNKGNIFFEITHKKTNKIEFQYVTICTIKQFLNIIHLNNNIQDFISKHIRPTYLGFRLLRCERKPRLPP